MIIKSLKLKFAIPALSLLALSGCDVINKDLIEDILDPELNPVQITGDWKLFFYHVHTVHSEDNPDMQGIKWPVKRVITRADQLATHMGVDAAITLTDHRTLASFHDPDFAPVGNAVPIKGEEWGGGGHAGALGYSGDTPITPGDGLEDYPAFIEETHAKGGIVVVNHPFSNEWKTDRALGIDAIEVLNIGVWTPDNFSSLGWWHRLLAAGEQITAVGGSDSHFFVAPIHSPTNLVFSNSNSQEDMLGAVGDGHLLLLQGPEAPRIFLNADLDNDGTYDDAMMGDEVSVASADSVSFSVLLEGAVPGETIRLFDKNGVFYKGAVGDGAGWSGMTYQFSRSFSPAERNFVRADIVQVEALGPRSMTNPIYMVGTSASSITEATLQGVVVSAGGDVIEGASIVASPGRYSLAETGAGGSYGLIVPLGAYSVTVSAPGYNAQVIDIVLDGGAGEVDLDVTLEPSV